MGKFVSKGSVEVSHLSQVLLSHCCYSFELNCVVVTRPPPNLNGASWKSTMVISFLS